MTFAEYQSLARTGHKAEARIGGALRGGWFIPASGQFIAAGRVGVIYAAAASSLSDFRLIA